MIVIWPLHGIHMVVTWTLRALSLRATRALGVGTPRMCFASLSIPLTLLVSLRLFSPHHLITRPPHRLAPWLLTLTQVEKQEATIESEQAARAELETCNAELEAQLNEAIEGT